MDEPSTTHIDNIDHLDENEPSATYIDHLDEDEPIQGQEFVCMSFLSPEKISNTTMRGVKFRGAFSTYKEAQKHCKKLQATDPYFDIYIGNCGKWLPWDPDPNSVKDQKYQEKELNDLMKGYKDNLQKSKAVQQQRKDDMLRNAAEQEKEHQEKSKAEKLKERLRKKLEAKKKAKGKGTNASSPNQESESKDQKGPVDPTELELKELDKLGRAEKERLNTTEQVINEKQQNLSTIDEKLARIQQLYSKLNSK